MVALSTDGMMESLARGDVQARSTAAVRRAERAGLVALTPPDSTLLERPRRAREADAIDAEDILIRAEEAGGLG